MRRVHSRAAPASLRIVIIFIIVDHQAAERGRIANECPGLDDDDLGLFLARGYEQRGDPHRHGEQHEHGRQWAVHEAAEKPRHGIKIGSSVVYHERCPDSVPTLNGDIQLA